MGRRTKKKKKTNFAFWGRVAREARRVLARREVAEKNPGGVQKVNSVLGSGGFMRDKNIG